MKRKLMLGLLSAVGGLTIIGSGFSAWYFGDNNLDATKSINANVTPLASAFGTITLDSTANIELILDQGGYANIANHDKGISFIQVSEGGVSSTFNGNLGAHYEIEAGDSLNAKNANLTATFECVVTLRKEFATYLDFKDSFYTGASTIGTLDGAKTFKVSKPITFTESKVTEDIKFNFSTSAELVNDALKYVDGKKPQTKAQFDDLFALNDTTNKYFENVLTFTYSLNVKEAA